MIFMLAFLMNVCNGLFLLSTPLVAIKELSADVLTLGLLGTSGACVYALSCAAGGVFADRYGRSRMLPLGCCILIIADCSILWVSRVSHLFFLVAAASLGAAMFWPSVMKWVGEQGEHAGLGKRVGAFNIAWSSGIMVGPFLAGQLYGLDYRIPYLVAASIVLCILIILVVFRRRLESTEAGGEETVIPPPAGDVRGFIYVAWLANFAIWFTIGASENLFPKLAVSLDISVANLGGIVALVGLGQMLMFFVLSHTERWHFKLWLLISFQVVGAAGAAHFLFFSSTGLFGLGFLMIGLAGGLTYFSSLFYSLYSRGRRGMKSGLHEAVLAAGVGIGPLAGGISATVWGLRAPYAVCAIFILAAMICEVSIYLARNRDTTRS